MGKNLPVTLGPVLIGLAAGMSAAVMYGVSAVLQARAFRLLPTSPWHRMLTTAVRSPAVLAVVALDGLGMLLHFVAIQHLPLYLAQACIASAVIFTALVAALLLHERPPRAQWLALLALTVGLVLLALGAGRVGHHQTGWTLVTGVYAAVVVIALLGLGVRRLSGSRSAVALGLLSGAAYGAVPVGARALEPPYLSWVSLANAGALACAGLLAFAFYSAAMTRAPVNTSSAPLTLTETMVPTLVGLMVFGDGIRPGWAPLMGVGLALSMAGAAAVPALAGPRPTPDTVES